MQNTYAGNSQFPQHHIVATIEDKREILKLFGNEIEIDEGIEEILHAVNSAPLFLTESSCQGSDGNPNSHHFDNAYIAIGALYNQFQQLELFAKLIKKQFRDKISCSFNSNVNATIQIAQYIHAPVFRTYLRIDFFDKSVFPDFKKAIEKFKENMPTESQLETIFYDDASKELGEYDKWNKYIAPLLTDLSHTSLASEKQEIKAMLNRFNNIVVTDEPARNGFPPAIQISFSFTQDRNVEQLFRPLAMIFGTEIKLYNPLQMDKHKNFTKTINIYLFKMSHLNLLHAILKKWCESPSGRLINNEDRS